MRNEDRRLFLTHLYPTQSPYVKYQADVLRADEYSEAEIAAAVEAYQKNIQLQMSFGGYHDGKKPRTEPVTSFDGVSHLVLEVTWVDGVVRVRLHTLPTPEGKLLAEALCAMNPKEDGTLPNEDGGVEIAVALGKVNKKLTIFSFDFVPRSYS